MPSRFTTAQFVRASQQLFLVLVSLAVLLIGAIVYAQDVLPSPAAPSASADTMMGWFLKLLLAALIAVAVWGGKKLTDLLAAKVAQTNQNGAQSLGWSLVNKLWLKAQASGGKILAKERPLLEKILSDGVVTADEFKVFAAAVAQDLRDIAAEEIPLIAGLMGGNSVVNTFVDGFAAKVAHQLLNGQAGAAPTQSPLPSVVPAPTPASPQ